MGFRCIEISDYATEKAPRWCWIKKSDMLTTMLLGYKLWPDEQVGWSGRECLLQNTQNTQWLLVTLTTALQDA